MTAAQLVLIVIIAESVLREQLIEEILGCGATGYTVWPVQGEGSRQLRSSVLEGDNVRFEVISSQSVAEKLSSKLAADYFPHYALVTYTTQVQVIRGEKYM